MQLLGQVMGDTHRLQQQPTEGHSAQLDQPAPTEFSAETLNKHCVYFRKYLTRTHAQTPTALVCIGLTVSLLP